MTPMESFKTFQPRDGYRTCESCGFTKSNSLIYIGKIGTFT